MTLAADLASDLSAGGGEVTAKLNTDQWVVVSVYVNLGMTYIVYSFKGASGRCSHCYCLAQPEEPQPHGGEEKIHFNSNVYLFFSSTICFFSCLAFY